MPDEPAKEENRTECQPTEHNFMFSCNVSLPENKSKLFFLCTKCGKLKTEIS